MKWREQLPAIKAENEDWHQRVLPKFRAYAAEQDRLRREREAEQREAMQALEWCRANGNPHTAAITKATEIERG